MSKFAYSTIPSDNSIKFIRQEQVLNDMTINHEVYLDREPNIITPIHHFSSNSSLLPIPIETLISDLLSNPSIPNTKNSLSSSNPTINRPLFHDFEKVDNSLWGDKYKVSKYSDLATDDSLNREALIWLQAWNEIVFESEIKSSVFGKRPEKVQPKPLLLISGPPGCGKTTLAKVVTSHFNYAPHEINCALLGSGKELLDTLKHSLSIKTVSGKPGILILDQIESIDKATIKSLTDLLSNKVLKRPTIAITNDLYSSTLIPLRAISQVLHSKLLNIDNLYLRLKEICSNERIYIPELFLKNLIKENKSDIRACINTIQLLSSLRKDSQLTIDSSTLLIAGIKESAFSIFDIWRKIFTESHCKTLNKLVFSYGDPEIINSGIHENYLNSKYTDYSLEKSLSLIETLQFNDVISTRIRENQQYELYSAQTLPAIAANRFCLSNNVELNFPVFEKKMSKNLNETQEALQSLKCRNLAHLTQNILVSDVFSFATALFGNNNFGFVKEIFENLGFEVGKDGISPDVKRIVRIPKGFVVIVQEIREDLGKSGKNDGLQGLASQKRKRDFKGGPVFVYHEGLTNAVRRKVKVSDLL